MVPGGRRNCALGKRMPTCPGALCAVCRPSGWSVRPQERGHCWGLGDGPPAQPAGPEFSWVGGMWGAERRACSWPGHPEVGQWGLLSRFVCMGGGREDPACPVETRHPTSHKSPGMGRHPAPEGLWVHQGALSTSGAGECSPQPPPEPPGLCAWHHPCHPPAHTQHPSPRRG